MKHLVRLFKEEEGQALTEYGILIGLIAVVVIGIVALLGEELVTKFTEIITELREPTTPEI